MDPHPAQKTTTNYKDLAAIISQGPNTLQEPQNLSPEDEQLLEPEPTIMADEDDNPLPDPVIFPAKGEHTHTFIFLHGRGDSGRNFAPWLLHAGHSYGWRSSLQDILPGVKFIFPSSRRFRIDRFKGPLMPQWFDILSLSDTWREEEGQLEGLRVSVRDVHRLMKEEMKILPPQRIILGGLSQGCATAFFSLLTFELSDFPKDDKAPFAAMIGMSGWLPFYRSIRKNLSVPADGDTGLDSSMERGIIDTKSRAAILDDLRELLDLPKRSSADISCLKTPVFLGHGAADPKVPPRNGEIAVASLRELGMGVRWYAYENFGHWIQEPDEVNDMIDFLRDRAGVEVVGKKEE